MIRLPEYPVVVHECTADFFPPIQNKNVPPNFPENWLVIVAPTGVKFLPMRKRMGLCMRIAVKMERISWLPRQSE